MGLLHVIVNFVRVCSRASSGATASGDSNGSEAAKISGLLIRKVSCCRLSGASLMKCGELSSIKILAGST